MVGVNMENNKKGLISTLILLLSVEKISVLVRNVYPI